MGNPFDELYAYNGEMFAVGTHNLRLLDILESNLLLLSAEDQEFVQSARLLISTGSAGLSQQDTQRLQQILGTLSANSHSTVAPTGESLSMVRVARELHGAIHTLNHQEKMVLGRVINKLNARQQLTPEEAMELLDIYTGKGF